MHALRPLPMLCASAMWVKLLLFHQNGNCPICFLGKNCLHLDAFLNEDGTLAKILSIQLERNYFVFGWFTSMLKLLWTFFPRFWFLMGQNMPLHLSRLCLCLWVLAAVHHLCTYSSSCFSVFFLVYTLVCHFFFFINMLDSKFLFLLLLRNRDITYDIWRRE